MSLSAAKYSRLHWPSKTLDQVKTSVPLCSYVFIRIQRDRTMFPFVHRSGSFCYWRYLVRLFKWYKVHRFNWNIPNKMQQVVGHRCMDTGIKMADRPTFPKGQFPSPPSIVHKLSKWSNHSQYPDRFSGRLIRVDRNHCLASVIVWPNVSKNIQGKPVFVSLGEKVGD